MPPPTWNGSFDEAMRLVEVITHHCECEKLKRRCPAHDMMLDQRAINHLLFQRWRYLHYGSDRVIVV